MRALAVDINNDIFVSNSGSVAIATGIDAVLQACEQAVKAQLGEMIYATDQGVPTFATIWSGAPNLAQFEAALRVTLLQVDNVLSVPEMTITRRGETVAYTARIITTFGETALNG